MNRCMTKTFRRKVRAELQRIPAWVKLHKQSLSVLDLINEMEEKSEKLTNSLDDPDLSDSQREKMEAWIADLDEEIEDKGDLYDELTNDMWGIEKEVKAAVKVLVELR